MKICITGRLQSKPGYSSHLTVVWYSHPWKASCHPHLSLAWHSLYRLVLLLGWAWPWLLDLLHLGWVRASRYREHQKLQGSNLAFRRLTDSSSSSLSSWSQTLILSPHFTNARLTISNFRFMISHSKAICFKLAINKQTQRLTMSSNC